MAALRAFRFVFAVALITVLLTGSDSSSALAEIGFTVTDIGSLVDTGDGQFDRLTLIQPSEVNNDGVVVANSLTMDATFWAVPFTNVDGKIRRLGREKVFSFALDVNASGEIAGYITNLDDKSFEQTKPVVWRDRKAVELPMLDGGSAEAYGINDRGDLVGQARVEINGASVDHAVLWQDDAITDLGTLGGDSSSATDLNNAGTIVGQSGVTGREGNFPCLWEGGEVDELPMPDGIPGMANAVNEDGVITGFALLEGPVFTAVRWVDREVEVLPVFDGATSSIAYDVNAAGEIVGWISIGEGAEARNRATLWADDDVIDLNDSIGGALDYALDTALAVNDGGQILAAGFGTDGTRHGVLLTPATSTGVFHLAANPRAPSQAYRGDVD